MTHAVIFDIDGTLLDSSSDDEVLYKKAIADVFGEVRFRDNLLDYEHVTDEGILQAVLADNALMPEPDDLTTIKQRFVRSLEEFVARQGPFREIPGARALLSRLGRSESHGIAIATGCWRQSAELKLAAAKIEIAGIPLATSDDAVSRTDIMRHALHFLSQGAGVADAGWESITYYGDGAWDREACRQLDWRFRAVGPVLCGLTTFDKEFPEQV